MPDDVDWQGIANSRAVMKKDGTPNVKHTSQMSYLSVDITDIRQMQTWKVNGLSVEI